MRKIILATLLLLASGLVQNTGLFSLWGIKPNLLLAVMVAVSFFIDSFPWYLFLVLLSVIFSRFEFGFHAELLAITFLLIAIYGVRRAAPWRPSVVNCFLVIVGTIIFYLISDTSYLFGFPIYVGAEIVYSMLFCILIYDIFRQIGDNEENIFKR